MFCMATLKIKFPSNLSCLRMLSGSKYDIKVTFEQTIFVEGREVCKLIQLIQVR